MSIILIDAQHKEETRAAVIHEKKVVHYQNMSVHDNNDSIGSIFLCTVARIEPSLQAAFINYGSDKKAFLPFSAIHPNYYNIPHEDKKEILDSLSDEEKKSVPLAEECDEDVILKNILINKKVPKSKYKIQEVIQKGQVLLVQVLKEGKGQKGSLVSTYISLAGRYCIFMPNTANAGGISKKILSSKQRENIKKITQNLNIPSDASVIMRTAALQEKLSKIKKDFLYLTRAWTKIRSTAMTSIAPALIFEDQNFVVRYIRDNYSKDIEKIHIAGETAYKHARNFIKNLLPSHLKKVVLHDESMSLFSKFEINQYIDDFYQNTIKLKSGGYIVIQITEALVSIDVNSGSAKKDKNIDKMAFRTNAEAVEEAVYQIRMRMLSGIIVIDLIDMKDKKNIRTIEKKVNDLFKNDAAKTKISSITEFGIIEISRKRIYQNIIEESYDSCTHCKGLGYIPKIYFDALRSINIIEKSIIILRKKYEKKEHITLYFKINSRILEYICNQKKMFIHQIEEEYNISISFTLAKDVENIKYSSFYIDKELK